MGSVESGSVGCRAFGILSGSVGSIGVVMVDILGGSSECAVTIEFESSSVVLLNHLLQFVFLFKAHMVQYLEGSKPFVEIRFSVGFSTESITLEGCVHIRFDMCVKGGIIKFCIHSNDQGSGHLE
jgi:hypothetical protein